MTVRERVPARPLPPESAARRADPADAAARTLTVTLPALRAAGYLPEAGRAREFADHYRQIKRPLVKRAIVAKTGAGAAAGAAPGTDGGVILVTSSLAGEGKTFTSVNLALSLATERDTSVLLVDADLLKPRLTGLFGQAQRAGLTDALLDDALDVESLVSATNIRGLSFLPAGAPRDGTPELVGSERMREILNTLRHNEPRRLVLLDSSPLLITSEGRILLTVAGQVVLVVRADVTPRQAMLDAIALFDEHQAAGIVLNDARVGRVHGYYGNGIHGDGPAPQS
jgi:exopolysaccharide/PEP-CTERM locus tyrosine autokinase